MDELETSPSLINRYRAKFRLLTKNKISAYSSEANDYFRKRVTKDVNINQNIILNHSEYNKLSGSEGSELIGRMYLYKYKAEMPGDIDLKVYDQYPLVFFFNSVKSQEGNLLLYGLNLHYLPPRLRMVLFEELLLVKSAKKYTPRTKLILSWETIKSIASSPLYEKCVHCYRIDRIQSQLTEIAPIDWNIVVFLQLANFVGINGNNKSASHNRKQINKKK